MPVRIYQASDASAPVLNNTSGSLIAVLDAVLVNGYGSIPALGWTKEFTGTNVAVYRNSTAPGSTGMYLRVNDNLGFHAGIRCYKTMSDINTGTDVIPNPSFTGYTSDIYWHKHYSGTGTPKQWVIIGDERTFYINIFTLGTWTGGTDATYSTLGAAGDFISFVPGNQWNYMVFGRGVTTVSTAGFPWVGASTQWSGYIGRAQDLISEKSSNSWIEGTTSMQAAAVPGSSTANQPFSLWTGQIHLTPAMVGESRTALNTTGKLRGAYCHAGRSTTDWFENMGKLPGEPTGPDLRKLVAGGNTPTTSTGSLIVRESDWDG